MHISVCCCWKDEEYTNTQKNNVSIPAHLVRSSYACRALLAMRACWPFTARPSSSLIGGSFHRALQLSQPGVNNMSEEQFSGKIPVSFKQRVCAVVCVVHVLSLCYVPVHLSLTCLLCARSRLDRPCMYCCCCVHAVCDGLWLDGLLLEQQVLWARTRSHTGRRAGQST